MSSQPARAQTLHSVASTTAAAWQMGSVKWFDPVRRFGFIVPDAGDSDIFLPWTTLRACGVREADLRDGIRVKFQSVDPEGSDRRPKATKLALVNR